MALEGHPVLADLGDLGQRHHLEAAAVGQDRPLPAHQVMQAAQPLHPLGPGPEHQVIGVAEQDVGPGLAHLIHRQRLHRAGRGHRHEGGRADLAPGGGEDAGAGGAVAGVDGEGEGAHAARSRRQASP